LVERCRVTRLGAHDLGAVDEALRAQETDGQLVLAAGGAHRDRDRDRLLAWTGRADLERGLTDDPVIAQLESGPTHRHDRAGHHVAGRGRQAVRA
jgi:hypothetical protein